MATEAGWQDWSLHSQPLSPPRQGLVRGWCECGVRLASLGMENFKVIRKLGKGAQGSVFLAEDKRDGKQYVVKKVECSDEADANKAFKEVRRCDARESDTGKWLNGDLL